MRRKRLAMLTSWQNVPRTLFMQMSAAITEHSFFLAIYPSIMIITEQIRCLHPCYEGQILWNTIYEVTTHLIVMLFCKYCQNVKKSDSSCIVMG